MNFAFTDPEWLWALVPAGVWCGWLAWRSDAATTGWRRWLALGLRLVVVSLVVGALAGLQWREPKEGTSVMFLVDRSDSVPAEQQELARRWLVEAAAAKPPGDRAGVIVIGADASVELPLREKLELPKFQAVVSSTGSDLARAIRLGAASFSEFGQKRLVVLSDGNENIGDAVAALASALPLGVSVHVVPLGVNRRNDVAVERIALPAALKQGQTFEAPIHVLSDVAKSALLRLYRNDQFLGEQPVELAAGKNLFTLPQTLPQSGFYAYDVWIEAEGDPLMQNNRASGFVHVRGDPQVLLVSADPEVDATLVAALRETKLQVRVVPVSGFPSTLAAMQAYDAIVLSNVNAGDVDPAWWRLLEAAVRDFGVGVVCIGGENTYLAGSYKGTPLETLLPVSMELDSKKILPSGAVVLVIDRSGSMSGDKLEMAKTAAMASVDALTDRDYVGVVAFDEMPYEVVPIQLAKDRKDIMSRIAGIGIGGGTDFHPAMEKAHEMLKTVKASLKHCVLITDGHSQPGDAQGITSAMVADRITVSTVGIGDGSDGALLNAIATVGKGRFYEVPTPAELPQIFLKETSLVLKSAINEDPFVPRLASATEPVRGIGEMPQLLGYVASQIKPRAEQPLVTPSGDPLLAHWQFGLGRTVAFTSDAKAKWARPWLDWARYRQFWSQVVQWSLRRVAGAELQAEIIPDQGDGVINVEAVDAEGNYRNFLSLEAAVISPSGEKQTVRLEQSGAGRYEAKFPMREVGTYLVNVLEMAGGQVRGAQPAGVSVNYSPEFKSDAPNLALLKRLAEMSGGRLLDPRVPGDNPFKLDRKPTFQPVDLWPWLVKLAIVLFVFDVAVRRIDIGREELEKMVKVARRALLFWRPAPVPGKTDESLAALLARRDRTRQQTTATTPRPVQSPRADLFEPVREPVVERGETPGETVSETPAPTPPAPDKPAGTASTAGRLLEAKRRARRK
jgi:Mg-chelatase subunit ChlD